MAEDTKKMATPTAKTATEPPSKNQAHDKPVKSPTALREEKTLEFWTREKIFQKSIDKVAPKGDYVFYDGPPFATGLPHFGHVLPTSIKDAIPRYKTMQGYRVRRRWGWDCHGLPVENLIEKELGLKAKKDIIDYGIGRFNEAARAAVLRYEQQWRTIIPRLGRFVDMDNDYKTMNASYTESVWWAFKTLHDKGLIYEGFKSMQICPRCETTLANFEVNQGYKDITDISVYVKFELADEPNTYLLAWTTTPWTLPGNVALAVNPDIPYVRVEMTDEPGKPKVIFAKARLDKIGAVKSGKGENGDKGNFNIVSVMSGKNLLGKSYKPVFDYYSNSQPKLKNAENGWKIYAADFVATDEGTGIVHIAPAFGADDMELGKKHNLPFIQHVGTDGKFKKEVTEFAGQPVKPKDGTILDKDGKPEKDAHQSGDVAIIKYLSATHTVIYGGKKSDQTSPALFAKEKIIHPYAHCWRCDTPLLNYAASSWFVKVPDIKDKLVSENKKVAWVPEDVGQGRFGNWLLGARDWAISRSRFWGAPLPVWRTVEEDEEKDDKGDKGKDSVKDDQEKNKEKNKKAGHAHQPQTVVIGSLADLKKYSHANNAYFVMRHGEAENNTKSVISSKAEVPHHLTKKGKQQVTEAAHWLADKKIDIIYVSPFVRTRETADIVAKHIGIPTDTAAGTVESRFIIDPALGELNAGDYNGMNFQEFVSKFPFENRFEIRPPNGESYADIKIRMGDFLYGLEKKYSGKRILIVTHDSPAYLLVSAAQSLDRKETLALNRDGDHFIVNGLPFALDFTPLPHNGEYELDVHRPYIDDIELRLPSIPGMPSGSGHSGGRSGNGRRLVRIAEVFDCWFESGSMPFAEAQYPFKNIKNEQADFEPKTSGFFARLFGKKNAHSRGYPADFIAEGQDQTRGWFYSLLVLGTALFGKAPYKNVVVNGLVLAEDGQKMSKSKNNFPDLMITVDKFGADALRFYLLSSPLVRAQEFCFSERGVDEVAKKHIGRLSNVVSFYEMYASAIDSKENISMPHGNHVLDRWILARLAELTNEVTKGLESYELDRATRPFADFIDDLSTWYIRRSRDRFKSGDDKRSALTVTRYVLFETAKLLAPFMPFLAEDIYQRVTGIADNYADSSANNSGNINSVHLEQWPNVQPVATDERAILEYMSEARRITSLALEARMKAKINVRQPLAKLTVASSLFELKNGAKGNVKDSAKNSSKNDNTKLYNLYDDFISLVKDEINVKEIVIRTEGELELDTALTPALKEEGDFRELVRAIQDLRKKSGLTVTDIVDIHIKTDYAGKHFIENKKIEIMKAVGLKGIIFGDTHDVSAEIVVGDFRFILSFEK
jgi:isoleucyl-tRNA synthetase